MSGVRPTFPSKTVPVGNRVYSTASNVRKDERQNVSLERRIRTNAQKRFSSHGMGCTGELQLDSYLERAVLTAQNFALNDKKKCLCPRIVL